MSQIKLNPSVVPMVTLDPFAPMFFPETSVAFNPLPLFPFILTASQGCELSCNKDAFSFHHSYYFHSPYTPSFIPHPYTSPLFPFYDPPLKFSTAHLQPPLIPSYTIEPAPMQVNDADDIGAGENGYPNTDELVEETEQHDRLSKVAASRLVARGPRGCGGRHRLVRQLSPALRFRWVPKSSPPEKKPFRGVQKLEDLCFSGEDSTVGEQSGKSTVMVKNIPNKFSFQQVLEMLDDHCFKVNNTIHEEKHSFISEFDFLYLPMDFVSGNNLGYAFVNFTNTAAARKLYRELHMKSWGEFGSRKVCEVTHARIQGLEGLLRHFRNSVFSCSSAEYLPAFYQPCRDGFRKPIGRRIGKLVKQPFP